MHLSMHQKRINAKSLVAMHPHKNEFPTAKGNATYILHNCMWHAPEKNRCEVACGNASLHTYTCI
jgi:hypothetical protein